MARRWRDSSDATPSRGMKIVVSIFLVPFFAAGFGLALGVIQELIKLISGRPWEAEQLFGMGCGGAMFLGIPSLFVYLLWFAKLPTGNTDPSAWKAPRSTDATPAATGPGARVIEPSGSPVGKFLGITFFCLAWNGFIGFFSYMVWTENEVVGKICLTPFQLIGLLLIISVPYQFLAMFNPRPTLRLSTGEVRLGHDVGLAWSWSRSAASVERLELTLEGYESATYRRGTTTTTDTETFMKMSILDTKNQRRIERDKATFTVPLDTMHTFEGRANKILWKIKLQGHIRRWPDVIEEYSLTVLPVELVEE